MQALLTEFVKDNTLLAGVIGALTSGVFVALSAVITLSIMLRAQARTENRRRQQELANIRLALHTEINSIAVQCLLEFNDWCEVTERRSVHKKPQTALLPPLRIYNAMASKFGRLSRDEIVALVGFASALSDISVATRSVLADVITAQPDLPYSPRTLLHLFSNACGKAAECLRVISVPGAVQDRRFIEELERAREHEEERKQAKVDHPLAHLTPHR